ncbi:hypothetical protein IFM89_025870 [Coptis chinensis]|uniref:Transposase-associated domain-containing protein n=1 Tax=Coptis chinensis TaxID=261450 RepID=A0A835H0Y9_9MAGN|nr:hypothetical protein IFM89_025870 [Coptis chinensis]
MELLFENFSYGLRLASSASPMAIWIKEVGMSQPIPKDWMNENDRLGSVYRQGVSDFILFASGKDETSTTCPCPCNKCRNRKRFAYDIVRKHLIHNGIESTYRVWVLHGENPYKDRMVNRVEEENSEKGLGIGNFVDVAYGMHEELVGDLSGGDGSQKVKMLNHLLF